MQNGSRPAGEVEQHPMAAGTRVAGSVYSLFLMWTAAWPAVCFYHHGWVSELWGHWQLLLSFRENDSPFIEKSELNPNVGWELFVEGPSKSTQPAPHG